MTPGDCETTLRTTLPGFSFALIRPVAEQGWDFHTFVIETGTVEGDWVFRFPRNETAARALEREFALLPSLGARMPIRIPRYEHRGERNGFPFGGYRYVEGRPVEPGVLTVPSIASQLAGALNALHGFPIELAKARLGIANSVEDWRQENATFLEQVRLRGFPLLSAATQPKAEHLFAAIETILESPPPLTLVHRDLGLVHVLGEGDRITGIIDWSDVSIGDPAIDFAGIMSSAGERGVEELLPHYKLRTGDDFRMRVRAWWQLAPFHDVLHALETADPQLLAEGIAGIETRLS